MYVFGLSYDYLIGLRGLDLEKVSIGCNRLDLMRLTSLREFCPVVECQPPGIYTSIARQSLHDKFANDITIVLYLLL